MPTVLRLLLLALVGTPAAFAQYITPFAPVRAPLAASTQVPADFELYTHDTPTQLLVNPARAAMVDARFAYATLGSPLAVATVVGTRNAAWLVQVDNAVDRRVRNYDSAERRQDGARVSATSESVIQRVPTRLRVATVRPTAFGGIALGFTGGYRSDRARTEDTWEYTKESELGMELELRTGHELRANDAYYAGLELGLAGRRWDFTSSLSYTRLHVETTSEHDTYSFGELDQVDRESRSARPHGVLFDVHASVKALTHEGRLFAAVRGHHLTGQFEGDSRQQYSGVDETRIATPRDASQSLTRVAVGFVQAHRDGRLSLSVGVSPYVALETQRVLAQGLETSELETARVEHVRAGVVAPMHAAIQLSRAVSLFGGGLARYTLDAREDANSIQPGSARRFSSIDSHSAFYLGTALRHPSGVAAQVAFNGSATDYSRWTVSLGYHF